MNNLTDKNFDSFLEENHNKPIQIHFHADWCGPCQALKPHIASLEKEMEGKVVFGYVNVQDAPDTLARFAVRSIPYFLLFENGDVTARGASTVTSLEEALKNSGD